ncbi:hypothetical protein SAY87_015657 [Trapa incisa]|uniref:Uncharacterized protein n=1 Tax=Trapa incisa TaxID=236973 RepID=A0AAN7QWS1_9MYRT|nr:hypothetical protein SAY87_015657 [Trapa incisa]
MSVVHSSAGAARVGEARGRGDRRNGSLVDHLRTPLNRRTRRQVASHWSGSCCGEYEMSF